jgi:cyclomaltodextrinase / maltogenic alpha-amylase / neopullulanase
VNHHRVHIAHPSPLHVLRMQPARFAPVLLVLALCVFAPGRAGAQAQDPPAWSRGAVWYLIVPDRFDNGDAQNDATPDELFGDPRTPWEISRWTGNWFERTLKERMLRDNFTEAALLRQYGGDIAGIARRLPYLDSLGVQAIVLTPVFEAVSSHKYDVSTLHHVDCRFGPRAAVDTTYLRRETPADPRTWYFTSADRAFLDLVKAVHARGMKIIISAQFAHCGVRFWAFEDVLKKQETSAFGSWFDVAEWDSPETPSISEFRYTSMWNVPAFPRFRQDTLGLVAGPREYVWAATRRWMDPDGNGDPADGIDGWLMDLTGEFPAAFWKAWASHVRGIKPEVLLVSSTSSPTADPYFDVTAVKAFGKAATDYFLFDRATTSGFDRAITLARQAPSLYAPDAAWNLISSHESERLASMCVNARLSVGIKRYLERAPREDERAMQRAMTVLQFSFPGAPVIYYGDEGGMWGGEDPGCRKPMVWPDSTYKDEVTFEVDGDATPQPVAFDTSLFNMYRTLIRLRREHPALVTGAMSTLVLDDVAGLYAFSRTAGADRIIIVVNGGSEPMPCALAHLDLPDGIRLDDPFNGVSFYNTGGKVSFVIPGHTVSVLVPAR